MKRSGILLALFLSAVASITSTWFSKDGKDCALVQFDSSIGEWNVINGVGPTAIFPEENDALSRRRRPQDRVC
jgi:hypothetical protein